MRAPSPPDPIIKIFFSHNLRDAPVTKSLIRIIERHTDNIKCFTSEDIEKGTDWRKTIAEHLALASVLVVVFTDPDEDWGWVLYETGFFDSLVQKRDATNSRRMYCLQNPLVVPTANCQYAVRSNNA
jgi:hypothetical protein